MPLAPLYGMNNNAVATETELVEVQRVCSWHPQFFGTELVLGTVLVSKALGTFGSHGICSACGQAIRKQTGLSTKEAV